MERRFEQAIAAFLDAMRRDGPNGAIASALAQAYEQVAFQDLADQVRRSVRSCRGNRWMFRVGGVDEHPIRIHPRLLARESEDALFPILVERTPVRLDLSHSGWSDIFFLGMDYPEGARVLNISVDLGVHGRDDRPGPADRDPAPGHPRADPAPDQHRPQGVQGRRQPRGAVQLRQRLSRPGQGGRHRLGPGPALARRDGGAARRPAGADRPARPRARDRQQGQRHPQGVAAGGLDQPAGLADRPVDARDRPGAQPDRPARPRGVQGRRGAGHPGRMARGLGRRLAGLGRDLPRRQADPGRRRPPRPTPSGASAGAGCSPTIGCSTSRTTEPTTTAGRRADSFPEALAREPGPRPRRHGPERRADPQHGHREVPAPRPRRMAGAAGGAGDLRRHRRCVARSDVRGLGLATTRNWDGPLKRIIPWVTNEFTETIIREAREALGDDFWGFLMLGGMSGGGMAFFVAPARHDEFQDRIAAIMRRRQGRARRRPAVRHGAGRLRLPDQPGGDDRRARLGRPRDDAPGVLHASGPPDDRRRDRRARSRGSVGPTSTTSPTTAADTDRAAPRLPDDDQQPLPRDPIGGGHHRPPAGTRTPSGSAARTASTPSSTSSSARTSSAGGSAWPATACPVDLDVRDVDDSDLIAGRRPVAGASRPSRRGGDAPTARSPSSRSPPASAAAGRPAPGWSRRSTRSSQLAGPHRSFLEIHLAKTRKLEAGPGRRDPPRRHHQLPDPRRHRAPPARRPATTATTARSTCRAASRSASA